MCLTYGDGRPVVTMAALEEYQEAFSALRAEYPECWWFACVAEDQCRGEHFARILRDLERAELTGARSVHGVVYDVACPWASVFVAAARDAAYWDRTVRRPAIAYMTRGSVQAMPSVSAATSEAVAGIMGQGKGNKAGGTRQDEQQPGRTKPTGSQRKKIKQLNDTIAGLRAGQHQQQQKGGKAKGDGKNMSKSGLFTMTRDRVPICYKWAKEGRAACPDVCPNGRAHVCQICLQPHPNSECSKFRKGGGK